MSKIAWLESLADFWELIDYAGLFLVFVGVAIESLVEFTSLITSSFWKSRIGKASALILVIGLTLELIASARLSTVNRQVIAILAEETADAEKRAVHAEKATEEERAARVKLEAELSSKRLSEKEH